MVLGEGTTRLVLSHGRGRVIKVSLNEDGIAANRTECQVSAKFPELPITHVLEHDIHFRWVVAERANITRIIKEADLLYLMDQVSGYIEDLWSGNCGYLRGSPVVIDYGSISKSLSKQLSNGNA